MPPGAARRFLGCAGAGPPRATGTFFGGGHVFFRSLLFWASVGFIIRLITSVGALRSWDPLSFVPPLVLLGKLIFELGGRLSVSVDRHGTFNNAFLMMFTY